MRAPLTTSPGRMRPTDPMAEALRAALDGHARKLEETLPHARRGDSKAIHAARTTIRRLREGLDVMGSTVFDPEKTAKLGRGLRRVERSLGPARDDDVLLAHIDEWLTHATAPAALKPLRDLVGAARDKHARALAHALGEPRAERAMRRTMRALCGGLPDVTLPVRPKPSPHLVRDFAPRVTLRDYAKILALEAHFPADVRFIHRVRSSCRRLRYLVDMLAGALSPNVADVAGPLRALQDRWGILHDHAVAVARIEKWVAAGKLESTRALTAYVQARRVACRRMRADFERDWRALTGSSFRSSLQRLVTRNRTPAPA
jgi:CHAD domain-containing protein